MSYDSHHPSRPSGFEHKDASVLGISLTALVVVGIVAASAILLDDFFVHTQEQTIYEQALRPISPERMAMDATQDTMLSTYGMVDSATGMYRMPIDSAMKRLAEKTAAGTR